jgi:Lysyl oxidase
MNRPARLVTGAAAALVLVAATLALTGVGGTGDDSSTPSATPSTTPSATATESAAPSPTPDPYEGMLLPNMRSLNAFELQIERTGNGRLLRFAAALANLGPGPLLLLPRPNGDGCGQRRFPAVQRIYRDARLDERYRLGRDRVAGRRLEVGCMVRHPTHDHWHFDAMARYSLRRAGTDDPLVARNKVSFCLRDNRRVPGSPRVVRREHFGDCTRRTRQGISPGWVDVYSADLDGQSLRLPRGVDGRQLCLDLEADPREVLTETDETDNAATIGIRIRGSQVQRTSPKPCR